MVMFIESKEVTAARAFLFAGTESARKHAQNLLGRLSPEKRKLVASAAIGHRMEEWQMADKDHGQEWAGYRGWKF